MEPLVSIDLLTFNHEAYIEDCIAGLLAQDYPNMELIILDDASTDRTRECIDALYDKLTAKFHNVTLIYHKNNCGSVPHNVNEMLQYAKGEYSKNFSGDDIMCSQYISRLVKCMQEHPDVSVVYSNGYVVNDSFKWGNRAGRQKLLSSKPADDTCEEMFRKLMFGINALPAPSAMVRRKIYEKYGPYDETIPYEDYEYWLRISREEKFYYLDENLIYYRRAENSMTNYGGKDIKNKVKKTMLSDHMTIQKHLKYLTPGERKQAIAFYYQRLYQLSYRTRFYRGFIVTAYKIKNKRIDYTLDFKNKLCRMIKEEAKSHYKKCIDFWRGKSGM